MNEDQHLIVPEFSLVKYRSPVRVTDWHDTEFGLNAPKGGKKAGTVVGQGASPLNKRPQSVSGREKVGDDGLPLAAQSALMDPNGSRTLESTEQILRSIMPPKRFQSNGNLFIQEASSCPASRIDVVQLTKLLESQLETRGAKMTGICPIRRELFTQVFDELIRQMTIQCAERGLLLLRVRNEVLGTIAALRSIYASGVVFGLQKCLAREADRYRQEARIGQLENEILQLRKKIQLETLNIRALEEKESNRLAAATRRAEEDVAFLRKGHDQLKAQLEEILNQFKMTGA